MLDTGAYYSTVALIIIPLTTVVVFSYARMPQVFFQYQSFIFKRCLCMHVHISKSRDSILDNTN